MSKLKDANNPNMVYFDKCKKEKEISGWGNRGSSFIYIFQKKLKDNFDYSLNNVKKRGYVFKENKYISRDQRFQYYIEFFQNL